MHARDGLREKLPGPLDVEDVGCRFIRDVDLLIERDGAGCAALQSALAADFADDVAIERGEEEVAKLAALLLGLGEQILFDDLAEQKALEEIIGLVRVEALA